MNYSNWLCWKISAQTVAAVAIAVSRECCRANDGQLGQIPPPPPSHPARPIDAVRANSAFRAQGLLPRGKYPIVLAWQLQAGMHGAQEGTLQLTRWDRALVGLLEGPQLRDAVDVVLGRPKPSYPPAKVAKPLLLMPGRMAPCMLKVTTLTFSVLSRLFFLSWINVAPLS